MLKVLFDINILRAVLLEESKSGDPLYLPNAKEAWKAAEELRIEGWVAAFSLPIIFSQCENYHKGEAFKKKARISADAAEKIARGKAYADVRRCINVFYRCELINNEDTLDVTGDPRDDIAYADYLMSKNIACNDFEDNLQIVCAYQTGIRTIVTDNGRDFACADDEFGITVLTPAQLLKLIPKSGGLTKQTTSHGLVELRKSWLGNRHPVRDTKGLSGSS